jgi:hypothetical protein
MSNTAPLVATIVSGTLSNSYYWDGANCTTTKAGGCEFTHGNSEDTASNFSSTSHAVYNGTTAWDFTNIWKIPTGQGCSLPILQYQDNSEAVPCPN